MGFGGEAAGPGLLHPIPFAHQDTRTFLMPVCGFCVFAAQPCDARRGPWGDLM